MNFLLPIVPPLLAILFWSYVARKMKKNHIGKVQEFSIPAQEKLQDQEVSLKDYGTLRKLEYFSFGGGYEALRTPRSAKGFDFRANVTHKSFLEVSLQEKTLQEKNADGDTVSRSVYVIKVLSDSKKVGEYTINKHELTCGFLDGIIQYHLTNF